MPRPDPRGSASLRRQLIGFVAGVIVISGGVLLAILVPLRAQAIRSGEELADSFAQVIAEQTTRTFQTIDQRLHITVDRLGRLGPIERLDASAARGLLQDEIAELPFVRALSLIDSEGRVVASSDSGAPGRSVAEREYFRVYREKPDTGFHIGPPVRGLASGAWLVSATRPLPRTGGAFGGLVVAAVEVTFFDRLWRAVDLGDGGSITLFRSDGLLMMRSPFDEATMGRTFPSLPVLGMIAASGPSGHFANASFIDERERLFAYRVLPDRPELVVVVGQTRDLILAPWRQLATISLSIWTLASIIVITLGAFLHRAWVDRLVSSAEAKETAERLALATEASGVGVWDWDLGADRWFATPTFFAILGAADQARSFTGSQWLECIHPEERKAVAASMQAALTGADVPYRYEARVVRPDGSFRWVSVTGRVLARDALEPRHLTGVMIDVTESKAAERALKDSEAFTHSILDSVTAEIAVLDRDGVIIAVNEPWRRFAIENAREPGSPPPGTDVGANYLDACRDDTSPGAREAREGIQSVLEGRAKSFRHEYPCHSDAVERWFILTATPLGPGGRGAVVGHIEVTERRRAEVAIHASLREKEALLKEVHHRVKNNLQVIMSLLRIETSRSGDGGTKLVLKEMQARIRSMALLHEMLYQSGNFARVELADYLRRMTTQLLRGHHADPSNVSLSFDLQPVRLNIDQAIPCGLIVNEILTNSLKHGFPGGRTGEIRIALDRDSSGWIRLRVSDNGLGLPADFETRRHKSLGLQLVSDLTRQLGGELELGPPPGASFEVSFPSTRRDTTPIPPPA